MLRKTYYDATVLLSTPIRNIPVYLSRYNPPHNPSCLKLRQGSAVDYEMIIAEAVLCNQARDRINYPGESMEEEANFK